MNRTDIVKNVADVIGDKDVARVAVDEVVASITSALVAGDRVHITGVGVFRAEQVPSRMVRNPATNKRVRVKKTARVKFRPSVGLKDYITGRKKFRRPAPPKSVA